MSSTAYTAEQIRNMSYNELIGMVGETNRPPGGLNTLRSVIQHAMINHTKKVLEIGTSTGFTAIELARLTGCSLYSIDINAQSLKEAAERAQRYHVADCIQFKQEDATSIAAPDESFDVVFCGNVTSLINDRQKALREYARVLKEGGFLVAVPMYYLEQPDEKLLNEVRAAIQVNIEPHDKAYWMNMFDQKSFNIFFQEDYRFSPVTEAKVDEYVDNILANASLDALNDQASVALKETYHQHIQLFRRNLSIMGYTILVLRKENNAMDAELFTGMKLNA